MRVSRSLLAASVAVVLLGVAPMPVGSAAVFASASDGDASASAHAPGDDAGHVHRGRAICHATGDTEDPYDRFKVGRHEPDEKPWQTWLAHRDHEDDIIPPSWLEPDGRNWDADGQEIYAKRCLDAPDATGDPISVSAGQNHSCALMTGGTVMCWGDNSVGQLGDGTTTNASRPVQVVGISNAIAVSAGGGRTCALLDDATIRCWGYNEFGGLGDGTTTNSTHPVEVVGIDNAVAVDAAGSATCAVLSDGSIKCWGANDWGQLGNGLFTDSPTLTPGAVIGITDAVAVAGGDFGTCALIADGTMRCWGLNVFLSGHGDCECYATPFQVSGVTNAVAITGGVAYMCAVMADHTMWCWGDNTYGKLGHGDPNNNSPLPVPVTGMTTAVAPAAGWTHTCALLADGTIKCWGYTSEGPTLGSETLISFEPILVTGITTAIAIDSGLDHTCALLDGGIVKCWGLNGSGQIGDGTTRDAADPATVIGL